MTRILVIEHETDDPVLLFGDWLTGAGAEVEIRRPFAGDPLPGDLDGFDAMLVMGGAMAAWEGAEHPWLTEVEVLYRSAAASGVPALGICLGHQLACTAFGGRVAPNPEGRQVGLYEIGWLPEAAGDPLMAGLVLAPRRAVQWNRDIVHALPAGSRVLALAAGGEVQAARFAPGVWGVQWHPEVDAETPVLWADSEPGGRTTHAAALAEISAAGEELAAAWQPLAARFGELASTRADSARG